VNGEVSVCSKLTSQSSFKIKTYINNKLN